MPQRHITSKILQPGRRTIPLLILAVTGIESEFTKYGIHGASIKAGLDSNTSLATALLGFYSSTHDLESAQRIFDRVPVKDLVLWSSMVSAFCKNSRFLDAVCVFREMLRSGIRPNAISLLGVLPACANTGALLWGKQIHGFTLRREFDSETCLLNAFIDMYAKCGAIKASLSVFHEIKLRDVFSWRNVILGCAQNGKAGRALQLFASMRDFCCQTDEIIFRNVIGLCACIGHLMLGMTLHGYALRIGLSQSASIGTSLLRMYSEFDNVEAAGILFHSLAVKDLIAWSAMISVYSSTGQALVALDMFREMQAANIEANEIVFITLLQACSAIEAERHGRSIHARIHRFMYSENEFLLSSLIDFYCKVGRLPLGEAVFNTLERKDLVCWNSMIHGYGVNGFGEDAIRSFTDMASSGVMPNEVVFVSLLSACSHCGMVDEAWKWFHAMEEKYGISPSMAHYTCIVDMLGRQGDLEDAFEFVRNMPFEPDFRLWSALLSWCRPKHEHMKAAEAAVDNLSKMDPANPSYHVTLSNLYCELGRWDDVVTLRSFIDESGLRKQAGSSIV